MQMSGQGMRVLLGIVLIGLGVMFLLDTLDVFEDADIIGDYWPTLLIAWGAWQWVNRGTSAATGPLIVAAIGVILLIGNVTDADVWAFWPVVLILVGVGFIFRQRQTPVSSTPTNVSGGSFVHTDVFGGGDRRYDSEVFKGGQMTAIFGGGKLDLKQAKLPPEGASLDVTAIFGGYEVFVPADWRVDLRTTAIFGGASDERRAAVPQSGPALTVTGTVLFGGLSVKG